MLMQDRALVHINLMNSIGQCREPRPIIVYPTELSGKFYQPRGTIVYRCNDQTGCCLNVGEYCRPKAIDRIERIFFVNYRNIGRQLSSSTGLRVSPLIKYNHTSTESITFLNHTACSCIKLDPNTIEHDEIQSVLSRPLINHSNQESINQFSSFFSHIIIFLSILMLSFILFIVFRFVIVCSTNHRTLSL
ncbi:hypothetical protein SSS_09765 [Sarcoptes scabiei]|nr:hypothetical protein SSS_09765 [Sarcoptes scabiei]